MIQKCPSQLPLTSPHLQDFDPGLGADGGALPACLQCLLQGGLCDRREGPVPVLRWLLSAAGLRPGGLLPSLEGTQGRIALTADYTLHTTYYTLLTTYYILLTTHYSLHTTVLRITFYTPHTAHYILLTTYCTLCTRHYILHTAQCILHTKY